MIYRQLGNTGLKVSQLGFGAMRLPMRGEGEDATVDREKATPMIHRAFEAGLNYIDTAVMYCRHDSQRAVGDALKGWRDKIVVSTKNHYHGEDEKEWWQHLENSLARLQVDYIDIYHHHGVNKDKFAAIEQRVGKWMRKAVDQGLVRHVACSFHDEPQVLDRIIDAGYPEVLTVQYNLLDQKLESQIARAHEKGIGVVVMGPVGGGRLGVDSEVLSQMIPGVSRVPELALRFVLSNPNVSVALSGMSTMQHVEENTAIASDERALTAEEKAAIEAHLEKLKNMSDLYCTGCKYCQPCPNEIDVPAVFSMYNLGKVYGLWDVAKQRYQDFLNKKAGGDVCAECGQCIPLCPQDIDIPEQLKEAHAALTG